ncbi:MAG: hypothetical protein PHS37_06530, partial [Candidatus Omnitrophica bacterium]|nr:hypothetical protein [Candidatus Omnitrophota bacterium]
MTKKIVTLLLIFTLTLDTAGYTLAVMPASLNPVAKRHILAALERTRITYAESEDAKRLLAANNTSCLLLSSGNYLVTKEVADDEIKLLRAIIHEDVEAVMQIIAGKDRYVYRAIKELIVRYFPPPLKGSLSVELYVNHTVARAFECLIPLREKIIQRNDLQPGETTFLDTIEPLINAYRHCYFTEKLWDPASRGETIRQALNSGMVFYQTASGQEIEYTEEEMAVIQPLIDIEKEEQKMPRSGNDGEERAYAFINAVNPLRLKKLAYLDSLAQRKDPEFTRIILNILRKGGQRF